MRVCSWLAAQHTRLHGLYADAVLAARPHRPGVVQDCALCLGAVAAKVGACASCVCVCTCQHPSLPRR